MRIKDAMGIFQGNFKTRKKVYTQVKEDVYSYIPGKQSETWKKVDINKNIKGKIRGL